MMQFLKAHILVLLSSPLVSSDDAADDVRAYESPQYWEKRYQKKEEQFDWYQDWNGEMKDALKDKLQRSHKILNIGCGNSKFSEQLYDDGYTDILNTDISKTVIDQMRQRYEGNRPLMRWEIMDCMNMEQAKNGSFDVVIDKGTLDALFSGSEKNVHRALGEISRVLNPQHGFYVNITYGEPKTRLRHLELAKFGWNVRVVKLPTQFRKGGTHYMYICTKGEPFVKYAENQGDSTIKKEL